MRKLLKKLVSVGIVAFYTFCAPVYAGEGYLYLGFEDAGKVYRLFTSDQNQLPTGYIFACEKDSEAFYVDQLQNFRFLKSVSDEKFKQTPGYIYRQVFDGLAIDADWGNGHAQCNDQRVSLLPDSAGKPVFRPIGAPFSSGTGQLVTEGVAFAGLEEGEFAVTEGKKWFRIPNGSWYQTWFPCDTQAKPSLKIFFDCWQEQEYSTKESIWRGFVPGFALERLVGRGSARKLIRAQVDGAMEILAGHEKASEFMGMHGFSFFHRESFAPGEGELLIHTWSDKDVGRLYLNGNVYESKPYFASHSKGGRFAGMLNVGNAQVPAVIGTDILQVWLQICGAEAKDAECTKAVFVPLADGVENRVFVYSEPQRVIFCFAIDSNSPDSVKLLNTLKLPFAVNAISADKAGNLYLGTIEMIPASFDNPEDFVAGYESLQINEEAALLGEGQLKEEELQKRKGIKQDFSGRFIFSKTGNAVVYVVYKDQITPVEVNRVFLDKIFYARECLLKNVSLKDLHISASELITLAEKPENSLAEVQGNVSGFPDQYRQPQNMLIAVP